MEKVERIGANRAVCGLHDSEVERFRPETHEEIIIEDHEFESEDLTGRGKAGAHDGRSPIAREAGPVIEDRHPPGSRRSQRRFDSFGTDHDDVDIEVFLPGDVGEEVLGGTGLRAVRHDHDDTERNPGLRVIDSHGDSPDFADREAPNELKGVSPLAILCPSNIDNRGQELQVLIKDASGRCVVRRRFLIQLGIGEVTYMDGKPKKEFKPDSAKVVVSVAQHHAAADIWSFASKHPRDAIT